MNHLISDDAKTVIRQLTELFMFAYMQKHDIKKKTIELESTLMEGSEILFENEETSKLYIDQYLSQHHVSNFNRKMIEKWRGAKKHNLYMMDEGCDFALMYDKDEEVVYGVRGLTDALSFTLREQTTPVKVRYAILPYRNFYIVDAIGMTAAIIDIDEIISLYEGFRKASYDKPVKISDTETTEVNHLARTLTDNINDVFMDYAKPLLYLLKKMPDALEDITRILLYAWNDVNEEKNTYQGHLGYEEFILPMMKRKKETFGQYKQTFEACKLFKDEDGLLQCELTLKKEKVEQVALF